MHLNVKALRSQAQTALDNAAYSPRRLVAIHAAATVIVSLVLSILNYVIGQSIDSTGGLAGIGTRSMLETLQSLLQMTNLLVLPFWQMGLILVMLRTARHQAAEPRQLLAGFSIFGPVLRLYILRAVICFLIAMIGTQIASTLYLMTPWGTPMLELTEQMLSSDLQDPTALITQELALSVTLTFLPFVAAVTLLMLVPVLYRLRLMEYCLLDAPQAGVFRAMGQSLKLTRKNCWKLAKIDLHFWWFYVLEAVTLAVCYGDILLPMVGVQLPMEEALASIVFYAAGLILQLGLYVWKKAQLDVTYACAYEALLPPPEIENVML